MDDLPKWAVHVLFALVCFSVFAGTVTWFLIAWAIVAFLRGW